MRTAHLLALSGLVACAPEVDMVQASVSPGGLEASASFPVERLEVYDEAGVQLSAATWPQGVAHAYVPTSLPAGQRLVVRASGGRHLAQVELEVPLARAGLVDAWLELPAGQQRRALAPEVRVSTVDDAVVDGQLWLELADRGEVEVWIDGASRRVVAAGPGERQVLDFPVGAGGATLRVGDDQVRIAVQSLSLERAREDLKVASARFPAGPTGEVDEARPRDSLRLPARWWRRALWSLGLGYRPRDEQAPWAWEAVTLANGAASDQSVVIRERILDADGKPVHAFRPRLRELDGQSDAVAVVLRVPAGQSATASLPVYADSEAIEGASVVWRELTVTPLGSQEPLHVLRRPLAVSRGSWLASAGFTSVLALSALGVGALLLRGRSWLASARTSELVTVALFGALSFVTNTTTRVLGYGVEAVLGPFAPLLTGLVDDTLRACLLAALVTLLPRPGIAALFSVLGYLLRGLALGSFHPTDLLYLGSVVTTLEVALWVTGLTRGGAWRDEGRVARWIRLSLALGTANLASAAAGYLSSIVLYRLFLADWYLGLMLLFPGFLYVVFGCWLAVDFADALRKVQV